MDKTKHRTALIEKIMGWTDSLLIICSLIVIKEYNVIKIDGIKGFVHSVFSLHEFFALLGLAVFWNLFALYLSRITRLHIIEFDNRKDLLFRILLSVTVFSLASMTVLDSELFESIRVDLSFVCKFWLILLIIFSIDRLFLSAVLRWFRHRRPSEELQHALIVGVQNIRAISLSAELTRSESGYSFVGFVDDLPDDDSIKSDMHIQDEKGLDAVKCYIEETMGIVCPLKDFEKYVSKTHVDVVFITLPIKSFYDEISKIIHICRLQRIKIRLFNSLFDEVALNSDLETDTAACYAPVLPAVCHPDIDLSHFLIDVDQDFFGPSEIQQDLKRMFDLTASLAAIILLSPVFLAVAVAVYLDDGWPVFFTQERIGLNKRRFKIFKFRTMIRNAEELQDKLAKKNEIKGAAFKITGDPRITKIGKFLRKTSLDEIPQFINVLIGDMSLVGPRPLPVWDFLRFNKETPWHRQRFSIKPGITCLWQVKGRNEIGFEEWMELDIQYIYNWDFWLDFKILFKTVRAVFCCTGAK